MSGELSRAAVCYGLYDDENIIGFIGILHFPHPRNKKIKTVSRLCVLPDYQGIGLGKKFLSLIARKYADEGFDVKITTSAKNLIYSLKKDPNWIMQRYSVNRKSESRNRDVRSMVKTVRDNCKTASFFFKNF